MSSALDQRVIFKPSRDYLRLMMIIYICSMYLVIIMSAVFWFKLMLGLAIIWQCYWILQDPIPQGKKQQLQYVHSSPYPWSIMMRSGLIVTYESMQILLDVELFFLMQLSNGSRRKVFPVFYDQLDKNQSRHLYLLYKIGKY